MSKCSKCGGLLLSTQTIQGHETAIWHAVCPAARAKHTTPTMSTVDIDSLKEQVSRMIIECRSQDGQIDEWGERELRDDFLALIAAHTTTLKAELLAKIEKEVFWLADIDNDCIDKDALTKIVNEL